MDDFNDIKVRHYRIRGKYIYVTLSNFKEEKILYTQKNEEIILKRMENRIKNEVKESAISRDIFEECEKVVLFFSLLSIIVSVLSLSSVEYQVLLIIASIMQLFTTCLYEIENIAQLNSIKFSLFFENRNEINEYVKKNPNLLDNIKTKSKESIIKNIEEKKENPVNVNTINSMKLKKLKELVQKVKFYKELKFETEEDLINDGLDELKEQNDSMKVEKPKGLSYRRTNS